MSFVQIGDLVRIYHEEHCFDQGEVVLVDGEFVTVDFYDWIELWSDTQLLLQDVFLEGIEVLIPTQRGKIVIDFRTE